MAMMCLIVGISMLIVGIVVGLSLAVVMVKGN